MKTRARLALASLVAATTLAGASLATPAGADPPRPAPRLGGTLEITEIHALRSDGGASIDPRLRDVPQLTRDQPFVRYNVYRFLDRRGFPLEEQKPVTDPLVNGRTLQVTLVDVVERGTERRFHIRTAIDDPGKQAFLKLLEVTAGLNEPFFVGGQSYEGGTLFLEIVLRP
jgi:hypothetical protein